MPRELTQHERPTTTDTEIPPRAPAVHARPSAARVVRFAAIDRLRGLAIVVMALDHVRDYFTDARYAPTDLTQASAALFLTRWVTHFCAPTFVFLAGMSAFLMRARRSPSAWTRFLLSRGLWLVLLEVTLVNLVWTFNLRYQNGLFLQVIWVLGGSMIVLAPLSRLPSWAVGALGAALIASHNLLDPITPEQLGRLAPVWRFLHVPGNTPLGYVLYPLVPWVAVMASGYAFGALYVRADEEKGPLCFVFGTVLCIGFVALRLANGYGDPVPWSSQREFLRTALSFLNVSKYPPSLAYLLMTLGPMLIVLCMLKRARGPLAAILQTFGQVPLFAYVGHLAIAHLLAGLLGLALGHGDVILRNIFIDYPPSWGFGLGGVYLAWLLVLAVLYPGCRWFAGVKRHRRDWWLAYL